MTLSASFSRPSLFLLTSVHSSPIALEPNRSSRSDRWLLLAPSPEALASHSLPCYHIASAIYNSPLHSNGLGFCGTRRAINEAARSLQKEPALARSLSDHERASFYLACDLAAPRANDCEERESLVNRTRRFLLLSFVVSRSRGSQPAGRARRLVCLPVAQIPSLAGAIELASRSQLQLDSEFFRSPVGFVCLLVSFIIMYFIGSRSPNHLLLARPPAPCVDWPPCEPSTSNSGSTFVWQYFQVAAH